MSCSVSRRDAVNGKEVYLLTRKPVEELPEKEVLVMAGSLMYDKLEQYVMSFNRNSREYHIIIRNYGEAELDAALVSSDPPDLINLTGLDHGKYGQKDVLEDLTPYLEESSLLDREAFLEAVLAAGTVKGRLVCIPDEITCTTVVGRSSQVGISAGWTAADAMALAEAHPEAELFINNSFSTMVGDFFGDYILERYVDWEKGKCSFDGEEFVSFMKWVAEHSGSADSGAIPMETLIGTMPEERLLSIWSDIRSLDRLLYDRAYFGEEVTAVGYPATDGSVCHHGTLINQMGIVTASERKEGAWRFLESFLSREDGIYTFLPSRRDRLEEMARGLMAEEKEDGSFEAGVRIFIPDNINQYYAGLTGEEVEEVLGIIESADFTPQEGVRKDILNILVEEMSPCLNGDKTYEEAAAIVQNRVQTCLNER